MAWKKYLALALLAITISACSSDEKGDGIALTGQDSGLDQNGNPISGNAADLTPGTYPHFVATVGDRVFFDFNSSAITSEGQATLAKQAEYLKQYDSTQITIEGHCDERGTREYNLALGERRANAVKNYIVGLGISASRVTVISYGKEHPEYLGSTEAEWSKNRRGVTVIN